MTGFTASGMLSRTSLNLVRGMIGNTCNDFYDYASYPSRHLNPHVQTGDDALRVTRPESS